MVLVFSDTKDIGCLSIVPDRVTLFKSNGISTLRHMADLASNNSKKEHIARNVAIPLETLNELIAQAKEKLGG